MQGRSVATGGGDAPVVRMPSEGRVVREAYRARVSSDLAKTRLGWMPAHPFELGARRTREWLRFARLVDRSARLLAIAAVGLLNLFGFEVIGFGPGLAIGEELALHLAATSPTTS